MKMRRCETKERGEDRRRESGGVKGGMKEKRKGGDEKH